MRRAAGLRGLVLAVVLATTACSGAEEAGMDRAVDPGATGTAATAPALPTGPAGARWAPAVGQAWQWQLSGELDLSVDVPVYDVDWQVTSAVTVARLHEQGRRVICYVSVGTWESYRPDAADYPEEVLGKTLEDWPDERWVDVRRLDVLGPLLQARLDVCRDKGFDAVEPDNVDGYANDSGFPLSADDQRVFNRWVAGQAHARGMSVGLKNDVEQVPDLVGDFDFAVNESCAEFDECDRLQPFLDAGKAVLHVEYDLSEAAFAALALPAGFSSMLKNPDLDAFRVARPGS